MSGLRDALADYLTIRRALGYKLREHEWALETFVSFLERTGASTITTELALQWACDTRGTEGWKAARLSMVRGFAVHVCTIDPATEVPPTGLLSHRKHYAIPYLYTAEQIGRLLAEAAALTPQRRAMLHGTVIGLLAVTGMRISEALHLDCDDVDLDAGVLTIPPRVSNSQPPVSLPWQTSSEKPYRRATAGRPTATSRGRLAHHPGDAVVRPPRHDG